jgi:predicted Zn-dependent peptidase
MPKQKIGRSILGTAQVIAKLPRAIIKDYVSRYYTASNMVVVAAGKIAHDDFVRMVTKSFGRLPKGKKATSEKAHVFSGVKLVPKEIEQVHLILGFAGPGYHAKADYYPTQLLSLILGGSSSSRLFEKVRNKRGLVYTINCGHAGFSDTGIFQIYAGTDPKRLRELIPVICDELNDVKKHVTRDELDRAKAQIRADLLMGKESVMRRAEVLGHQILTYGKHIEPEKILKRLMAVTTKDVQEAARKIFKHKPILTALGPLDSLEDYKLITKRLA